MSFGAPTASDSTMTVTAANSTGIVRGRDRDAYSGHDVTAAMNLHQGVKANGVGGYAAPPQPFRCIL